MLLIFVKLITIWKYKQKMFTVDQNMTNLSTFVKNAKTLLNHWNHVDHYHYQYHQAKEYELWGGSQQLKQYHRKHEHYQERCKLCKNHNSRSTSLRNQVESLLQKISKKWGCMPNAPQCVHFESFWWSVVVLPFFGYKK